MAIQVIASVVKQVWLKSISDITKLKQNISIQIWYTCDRDQPDSIKYTDSSMDFIDKIDIT